MISKSCYLNPDDGLVPPHGDGGLKPLFVADPNEREEIRQQAECLPIHDISSREMSDLLMLGMGAYTPLCGFMSAADWKRVCVDMRLTDGTFWPIPITVGVDKEYTKGEIALRHSPSQQIIATMTIEDCFTSDIQFECESVFGTSNPIHPGVEFARSQKQFYAAGLVKVIDEGPFIERFADIYFSPAQTRKLFAERGWSTIAAFQTRNPMHRSHEHLIKIAAEVTDGIFIHQVLGQLKPGDLPATIRTKSIKALLSNYFNPTSYIFGGYPLEMRYAGPREALLHALIRQNFGCSHMVVGRDHAGVGDFYEPDAAQIIFGKLWDGALQTQPISIGVAFYCRRCEGMATAKTCPHDDADHLNISGTRQRELLAKNQNIPSEFSRPEVVNLLREYYANQ